MSENKPKPSAAKTGAWIALILTFLAYFGRVVNAPASELFFASLIVGVFINFVVWWLIFTALVWLWRKIRGE